MNLLKIGKITKNIKDGQVKWNKVSFAVKESFISLIKSLGDLDLFFLTISHLIKKVSENEVLVDMMSSVMGFIDSLANVKKVKGKKLTL